MVHDPDTNAPALLEQLSALGIASVRVDADDQVVEANELFFQLTGLPQDGVSGHKLNDLLESTAAEHKSYGEGAVYRFATPRGERWLRPRIAGYKIVDRYLAEEGIALPLLQYVQPVVHRKGLKFTPHVAGLVLPQNVVKT